MNTTEHENMVWAQTEAALRFETVNKLNKGEKYMLAKAIWISIFLDMIYCLSYCCLFQDQGVCVCVLNMSNLFYFLRRETNADLLVYRLARTCFACVLVTGQWPRPLATWFCNKHWFGIGNYYLQKITSSQTVEVSHHFEVPERNNPYLLSTNTILSTPVLFTRQTTAHPVPWDLVI